jgi:hypothetical protein
MRNLKIVRERERERERELELAVQTSKKIYPRQKHCFASPNHRIAHRKASALPARRKYQTGLSLIMSPPSLIEVNGSLPKKN